MVSSRFRTHDGRAHSFGDEILGFLALHELGRLPQFWRAELFRIQASSLQGIATRSPDALVPR